jgi:phosphatidylethanolamine-binding protein (PEBP) family uncharacterized protein
MHLHKTKYKNTTSRRNKSRRNKTRRNKTKNRKTQNKKQTRHTNKSSKIKVLRRHQLGGSGIGSGINMIVAYSDLKLESFVNEKQDFTNTYINTKNKLLMKPSLELSGLADNVPYLLTMTDPNALGKTWTHWIVQITRNNSNKNNINANNSNANNKDNMITYAEYAPPSPPPRSGIHNYEFRLYNNVNMMPRQLTNDERGSYYKDVLENIISGKTPLAEVTFTIDSDKF